MIATIANFVVIVMSARAVSQLYFAMVALTVAIVIIAKFVVVVSAVSIVIAAKIVTTASTARGANNVKRVNIANIATTVKIVIIATFVANVKSASIAKTKSVPVRFGSKIVAKEMAKIKKKGDVYWHIPNRKRPIAYSTKSTYIATQINVFPKVTGGFLKVAGSKF